MKPILLSYEVDAYDVKYYAVPYDTEEELQLVKGLEGKYVNCHDISDDEQNFLLNIKQEWQIEGEIDLTQYRCLVTTGWIQ